MFSMIFFVFVALILVAGLFAVRWRQKNRSIKINDEKPESMGTVQRSSSAFNEPSTGDIKGGILPADNKLSQNDFDDENEVIK